MYLYLKALHIIFVVTWFAGMFYIVRLFIYNTEAGDRPEEEARILRKQFGLMIRRLWWGITWPSALLALGFGAYTWWQLGDTPLWLQVKLGFVGGLCAYHYTLHRIFRQQAVGLFRYRSQQLRIWNELATVFLVAIVMLAVVKQAFSWVWGLAGLAALVIGLMSAIRLYRNFRKK